MKKKLLGILGAFVAFFSSTSGIYNYDSVDPKTTNDNYLTFTNNSSSDDVYMQLYKAGTPYAAKLIYSTNDGTGWSNWGTFETGSKKYQISRHNSIRIVAGINEPGDFTNTSFSKSEYDYYQFKWWTNSSGSTRLTNPVISASGDVTSLLNGKGGDVDLTYTGAAGDPDYRWCFGYLFFSTNACLSSIPNLPSTKLAASCYKAMFQGCSNIISAPNLPAAELQLNCYYSMFSQCSILRKIPNLSHVTSIETNSVYQMFYDCDNLTITDPGTGNWQIGTTGISSKGTTNMFYGCGGVCTATPTVGKSYYLGVAIDFSMIKSLGGYYKKNGVAQPMVSFGATIIGDYFTSITEFGFEFDDGTKITSNATQLAKFKELNNGNIYTVFDCATTGITKSARAFVTTTISSTSKTYYSLYMSGTSNLTDEYSIPE